MSSVKKAVQQQQRKEPLDAPAGGVGGAVGAGGKLATRRPTVRVKRAAWKHGRLVFRTSKACALVREDEDRAEVETPPPAKPQPITLSDPVAMPTLALAPPKKDVVAAAAAIEERRSSAKRGESPAERQPQADEPITAAATARRKAGAALRRRALPGVNAAKARARARRYTTRSEAPSQMLRNGKKIRFREAAPGSVAARAKRGASGEWLPNAWGAVACKAEAPSPPPSPLAPLPGGANGGGANGGSDQSQHSNRPLTRRSELELLLDSDPVPMPPIDDDRPPLELSLPSTLTDSNCNVCPALPRPKSKSRGALGGGTKEEEPRCGTPDGWDAASVTSTPSSRADDDASTDCELGRDVRRSQRSTIRKSRAALLRISQGGKRGGAKGEEPGLDEDEDSTTGPTAKDADADSSVSPRVDVVAKPAPAVVVAAETKQAEVKSEAKRLSDDAKRRRIKSLSTQDIVSLVDKGLFPGKSRRASDFGPVKLAIDGAFTLPASSKSKLKLVAASIRKNAPLKLENGVHGSSVDSEGSKIPTEPSGDSESSKIPTEPSVDSEGSKIPTELSVDASHEAIGQAAEPDKMDLVSSKPDKIEPEVPKPDKMDLVLPKPDKMDPVFPKPDKIEPVMPKADKMDPVFPKLNKTEGLVFPKLDKMEPIFPVVAEACPPLEGCQPDKLDVCPAIDMEAEMRMLAGKTEKAADLINDAVAEKLREISMRFEADVDILPSLNIKALGETQPEKPELNIKAAALGETQPEKPELDIKAAALGETQPEKPELVETTATRVDSEKVDTVEGETEKTEDEAVKGSAEQDEMEVDEAQGEESKAEIVTEVPGEQKMEVEVPAPAVATEQKVPVVPVPAVLLPVESAEERAAKESVLGALGLQSLEAAARRAAVPRPRTDPTGYTGTLKTVIKVTQRSPEKRTRTSKMKLNVGSDKKSKRDKEPHLNGFQYSICKEPMAADESGGGTAGAAGSGNHITSNPALFEESAPEANGPDPALAGVGGGEAGGGEGGEGDKVKQSLVIPEKASSFSIHPDRLCSDVCSYCFGKFGSLDTPCHIAQLRGSDKQVNILQAERHLTAESCLCDACYRHVDRKANCPAYRDKVASKEKLLHHMARSARPNAACCVQGCQQPAQHHVRRKWLNKLKRSIAKKVPVSSNKLSQHTALPLCAQHFAWVDLYMACGICRRRLTCNQMYPLGPEVAEVNTQLTADRIPARLSEKVFLCKLCRYYSQLIVKHGDRTRLSGSNKMFYESYRKKIFQSLDMEVPAEVPVEVPAKRRKKGLVGVTTTARLEEVRFDSPPPMDLSGMLETQLTEDSPADELPQPLPCPATKPAARQPYKEAVVLELTAHVDFERARTVRSDSEGEWERCPFTLQYDRDSKAVFERMRRPYGNQSSFFKHLLTLEQYWRSGELVPAPQANPRTRSYLKSVSARVDSFQAVAPPPPPKAPTPPAAPSTSSVPVIDLPIRRRLSAGGMVSTQSPLLSPGSAPNPLFVSQGAAAKFTVNPATGELVATKRKPNIVQVTKGGQPLFRLVDPTKSQIRALQGYKRKAPPPATVTSNSASASSNGSTASTNSVATTTSTNSVAASSGSTNGKGSEAAPKNSGPMICDVRSLATEAWPEAKVAIPSVKSAAKRARTDMVSILPKGAPGSLTVTLNKGPAGGKGGLTVVKGTAMVPLALSNSLEVSVSPVYPKDAGR